MFCIPGVNAGQTDVFPAQRREMLEQMVRNLAMHFAQVGDSSFDIDRIPMHNRANDKMGSEHRCRTVLLDQEHVIGVAAVAIFHAG